MTSALFLSVFWLSSACTRGRIYDGKSNPEADPCKGATCTNVVDGVLRDPFTCRLAPITEGTNAELCRRIFVDFYDRLPTPDDRASKCAGKNVTELVDEALASPEYVRSRQRLWAERFQYNDARAWYKNIVELDTLVTQLYDGSLDIESFVAKAAIHPAVLLAADDQTVALLARAVSLDPRALKGTAADAFVERVFAALLGRSPTLAEMAEVSNLYRQYEISPDNADGDLPGFSARRLKISPCACAGSKRTACTTQVLSVEDVSLPLRFPSVADCSAEPGNSFLYENARTEELAKLNVVGKIIVARADFYKQQAAWALSNFVGYDLRTALGADRYDALLVALGASLKKDGSLKNLDRTIALSVLYRQSQTPETPANDCEGKPSPLFAGPRRPTPAHVVVAAVSQFTGKNLGTQDSRLQMLAYTKTEGSSSFTAFAPTASYYTVKDAQKNEPDLRARDYCRGLGGCADRMLQDTQNRREGFAQIVLDALAADACDDAAARAMLPASVASGKEVTRHEYQLLFGEEPSAAVEQAGEQLFADCQAEQAGCTGEVAARRVCAALIRSARFMTY